jgi:hypothetical protein
LLFVFCGPQLSILITVLADHLLGLKN